MSALDAVVTGHTDAYRSGVARFNEILARELGVPLLSVGRPGAAGTGRPLLSFKVAELDGAGVAGARELLARPSGSFEIFLHDFSGSGLEVELVRGAGRVWCGNDEVARAVETLAQARETVWAPGLVLDRRVLQAGEISVFSFGMAHKIQTGHFRRLRGLLEQTGRSFVLYVSAATHETSSMRDAQIVWEEMHAIFPTELFFLGNLSDVIVSHYLRSSTFFASFFPGGLRANNTSVASALEHGAVVVTNLDDCSPPGLRHLENVIDVERCDELPLDHLELTRLSVAAMEYARSHGWQSLVGRLRA